MNYKQRMQELQLAESELNDRIQSMPSGTISLEKDRIRRYLPDGKRIPLSPEQDHLQISALVCKAYLEKVLRKVQQELYAWKKLESHMPSELFESVFETLSPERQRLSVPYSPWEKIQSDWEKADFRECWKYQDEKIIMCRNGMKVRSKSERLIADRLFFYHIPFRYECGLYLNDRWLYPDFTILKLPEQNEIIWEHFGMVDESGYQKQMIRKLMAYQNLEMEKTLIFTMEAKRAPLVQTTVDHMIHKYILPTTVKTIT